jgi:hypothetical protein
MADANIKKIVIPKAQLPSIIKTSSLSAAGISRGEDFAYNIRYRVVSEDKNRSSHWSRIYNINGGTQVPGTNLSYSYVKETATTSTGTTTALRLNWIIPITLGTNTFDIFVKRDAGSYSYYGTSQTNTYVVLRESTETSITILVQTPTYPKAITTAAKLFETAAITVP